LTKFDLEAWYKENITLYQELSVVAKTTIESLLRAKDIEIFAIQHRTKLLPSLDEKFKKKEYNSISEVTDLCGIRVITYMESELKKVCDALESCLEVVPEKSLNKSEELDDDQVGYRSIHYILKLGADRTRLPELMQYTDLVFEVQVRTLLQHAWAEIEHDRCYKFKASLPRDLKRRLYLISGTLELVDAEFSRVVSDIEDHSIESARKVKTGDLDVEITSEVLANYLATSAPKLYDKLIQKHASTKVLTELDKFGVQTLQDFERLIKDHDLNKVVGHSATTATGLLRKIMIYIDMEKYFENSWERGFKRVTESTYKMMVDKYGRDEVELLIKKYGMRRS
jgi:putative GTP pyrophosphokinase